MARYLDMTKQQQLISLLVLGWPERRIARELGIHRNTVRRYAEQQRSKCTKTTTESDPDSTSTCMGDSSTAEPCRAAVRRPFIAASYKTEIEQAIAAGDTAQVIYQYLVDTHQYRGSYQSVKRLPAQGLDLPRPGPGSLGTASESRALPGSLGF
jgi:hypothetical protein